MIKKEIAFSGPRIGRKLSYNWIRQWSKKMLKKFILINRNSLDLFTELLLDRLNVRIYERNTCISLL